MAAVLAFASSGWAQQALYPLKEGVVQPFHNSDIPSWMTLNMELRGRTEEQTSLIVCMSSPAFGAASRWFRRIG
jgi:hypothetical protein